MNSTVAFVGEVRLWKDGNKYKKIANGKWVKLRESYVEKLPLRVKSLLDEKFFDALLTLPKVKFLSKNSKISPHYNEKTLEVYTLGGNTAYDKYSFVHEMGHHLHYNKGIITNSTLSKEFKEIFSSFLEEFNQKDDEEKFIYKKFNYLLALSILKEKHPEIENIEDKFVSFFDTVQAITLERYGDGHPAGYYIKDPLAKYMELFANGNSDYWLGNELTESVFPKSTAKMKAYFDKLFKNDKTREVN